MKKALRDKSAVIRSAVFVVCGAGVLCAAALESRPNPASERPASGTRYVVTETWNAVKQFSLASNPNGAWSYGFATTAGGAFTPLAFPSNPCAATQTTGLKCWANDGGDPNYAGIIRNVTGSPVDYLTIVMPPNVLWFAIQLNEVITRWTAPAAGEYAVEGSFTGIDTGEAPVNVGVYLNGSTSLAHSTITGYGQVYNFKIPKMSLSAGETIDFDGVYTTTSNNDNIGLQAEIYQIAP